MDGTIQSIESNTFNMMDTGTLSDDDAIEAIVNLICLGIDIKAIVDEIKDENRNLRAPGVIIYERSSGHTDFMSLDLAKKPRIIKN